MKLFGKKDIIKDIRSNPAGFVLFHDNQTFGNSTTLQAYINEGYKQNIIAYKCIREVATCIASIQLELWEKNKDKYVEKHPLIDLLNRPNPMQSGKNFMRELVTNYLISGSAFILKDTEAKKPAKELWNIPSNKVQVEMSKSGMPKMYKVGDSYKLPVDQITGESQMLQIRDISPEGDYTGVSGMQAAAISADLHNAALKWNYSLLKNGAKTPYAISGKGDSELTHEQKSAIVEWWNKAYQGEHNAGKPIILSGIDIKPIGLNPVDMDYINTVKTTANYICLAFGVPPVLVTGEGNTYNNMREAREAFYENTILPMLDEIIAELNRWLVKPFGEYELRYNPDAISALEGKRETKFNRMVSAKNAGLITIDEARDEIGYEEIGGVASELLVSPNQVPVEDLSMDSEEDNEPYVPKQKDTNSNI